MKVSTAATAIAASAALITAQTAYAGQCNVWDGGQLGGAEQTDVIRCLGQLWGWADAVCGGHKIWTWGSSWNNPNEGWDQCRDCLLSAARGGFGSAKCDASATFARFAVGYERPSSFASAELAAAEKPDAAVQLDVTSSSSAVKSKKNIKAETEKVTTAEVQKNDDQQRLRK